MSWQVTVTRVYVLSHFHRVQLCAALWTVSLQAPLCMGLFRQEYWSGLPCPPPGIFPTQGLNPCLLHQPALTSGFFTASTSWEAQVLHGVGQNVCSGFSIISCRKTRTNFLASPILLHIYRKLRAPCYLIVSGLDLWTQISHEAPKLVSSY